MSFFKELLSIKTFRENKAELNVGKQRVLQVQAVAAHEQGKSVAVAEGMDENEDGRVAPRAFDGTRLA